MPALVFSDLMSDTGNNTYTTAPCHDVSDNRMSMNTASIVDTGTLHAYVGTSR